MEEVKAGNSNYELFIKFINKFFKNKPLEEYLNFLEQWIDQITAGQILVKNNNSSEVLFFCKRLTELYRLTNNLINTEQEKLIPIKSNTASIVLGSLNCLSAAEIINPFLVIQSAFAQRDFIYYKAALQNLLKKSLKKQGLCYSCKHIFPLYFNVKKMLGACWLIFRGNMVAKLPYELIKYSSFESTCPNLLSHEEQQKPFQFVDSFYRNADLIDYRKDLEQWLSDASRLGKCTTNASNLLFLHNQTVKLLEVAHFIVVNNLVYESKTPDAPKALTLRQWIKSCQTRRASEGFYNPSDFDVKCLDKMFHNEPLSYLKLVINLNYIKELRGGLLNMLYAGLSANECLEQEELALANRHCEELLKIFEAFYLIITNAD